MYDGEEIPNVGFNAVAGRPVSEYSFEPARFDEMRKGAWDIHERIRDMDVNGIYASLCFPSFLPGFAGQRLQVARDPELALATVRAWNDWHLDEWAGSYPGRIIPCQLPYLLDPAVGADEVRRNAERGFKAITFPEMPHALGLPSLHSGHWDPLLRACAETGTVVNLHIGSSSTSPSTSDAWGGVDILFANAGIQAFKPLLEMQDADWHDQIDVNLSGTANVLRAFARLLVNRGGGRIIITSSTRGQHGTRNGSAHSASKWGLLGLMGSRCARARCSRRHRQRGRPGPDRHRPHPSRGSVRASAAGGG